MAKSYVEEREERRKKKNEEEEEEKREGRKKKRKMTPLNLISRFATGSINNTT